MADRDEIFANLGKKKVIKDVKKDKLDKKERKAILNKSKKKSSGGEDVSRAKLDNILGLTVTERNSIARSKISAEEVDYIKKVLKGVVEPFNICEVAEENNIDLYHLIYLDIITKSDMQNYLSYQEQLRHDAEVERKREEIRIRNEQRERDLEIQRERERKRKAEEEELRRQQEEERQRELEEQRAKESREKVKDLGAILKNSLFNALDKKQEESEIANSEDNTNNSVVYRNTGNNYSNKYQEEDDSSNNTYIDSLGDYDTDLNKKFNSSYVDEDVKVYDNRKPVYVIGSLEKLGLGSDSIEGYKLFELSSSDKFVHYLSNRDSLLVITKDMTSDVRDALGEWLNGVYDNERQKLSAEKYRIVSIKDKDLVLEHPIIERIINLNKEELDQYYEDNPFDSYLMQKVGFASFDSLLD